MGPRDFERAVRSIQAMGQAPSRSQRRAPADAGPGGDAAQLHASRGAGRGGAEPLQVSSRVSEEASRSPRGEASEGYPLEAEASWGAAQPRLPLQPGAAPLSAYANWLHDAFAARYRSTRDAYLDAKGSRALTVPALKRFMARLVPEIPDATADFLVGEARRLTGDSSDIVGVAAFSALFSEAQTPLQRGRDQYLPVPPSGASAGPAGASARHVGSSQRVFGSRIHAADNVKSIIEEGERKTELLSRLRAEMEAQAAGRSAERLAAAGGLAVSQDPEDMSLRDISPGAQDVDLAAAAPPAPAPAPAPGGSFVRESQGDFMWSSVQGPGEDSVRASAGPPASRSRRCSRDNVGALLEENIRSGRSGRAEEVFPDAARERLAEAREAAAVAQDGSVDIPLTRSAHTSLPGTPQLTRASDPGSPSEALVPRRRSTPVAERDDYFNPLTKAYERRARSAAPARGAGRASQFGLVSRRYDPPSAQQALSPADQRAALADARKSLLRGMGNHKVRVAECLSTAAAKASSPAAFCRYLNDFTDNMLDDKQLAVLVKAGLDSETQQVSKDRLLASLNLTEEGLYSYPSPSRNPNGVSAGMPCLPSSFAGAAREAPAASRREMSVSHYENIGRGRSRSVVAGTSGLITKSSLMRCYEDVDPSEFIQPRSRDPTRRSMDSRAFQSVVVNAEERTQDQRRQDAGLATTEIFGHSPRELGEGRRHTADDAFLISSGAITGRDDHQQEYYDRAARRFSATAGAKAESTAEYDIHLAPRDKRHYFAQAASQLGNGIIGGEPGASPSRLLRSRSTYAPRARNLITFEGFD